MPLKRISILGVGLLGGSIGLAGRQRLKGCKFVGYGHRVETLERAKKLGAVDEVATDPAAAATGSDLVILCTPVGLFSEILTKIAPHLKPGAIVTDVGSTKRSVVRTADRILPANVHFIGSHPLAGSEKRGVDVARADLYDNALCITTPTPQTHSNALATVETFWRTLGMRIERLTPEDHDRLLAEVSHLPHALAAAMVTLCSDAALKFAGKGLLDTTRIAGGDAGLWRDIFIDNADNLRNSLLQSRSEIDHLIALLDAGKSDEIKTWLADAAARRQALVEFKEIMDSTGKPRES